MPLTPLPEKFINLILAYVGIFENSEELKEHVLRDAFSLGSNKFNTGTEIYLCDLRKSYHSYGNDIVLVDNRAQIDQADESQNDILKADKMKNEHVNLEPLNSQTLEKII